MSERSLLLSERSIAPHEEVLGTARRFSPPSGDAGPCRTPSVMGALVAVRKGVGVSVVEQRVVSVTPRKFLQAKRAANRQETLPSVTLGEWVRGRRQIRAHLGADAQVREGHEFRLLVRVFLRLHVGVGHADGDPGQGQNNSQYLPGPRCGETGSD